MNIAAKRGWCFLISAILLIPGIVFLIIAPGLNPGIDFTGGSTMTVKFADPTEQQAIRTSLESLNVSDATVQNFGENTFFKALRPGVALHPPARHFETTHF